jgi:quercetin 2,3-dioxygenase
MITLCKANERHHVRRHRHDNWSTFRALDGADPIAQGYGALGAFEESRLAPGAGVAPRPRQEAEIVTYVLEGSLAQEDSTGRSGVVRAGEFQSMTTGGRVHRSEENASQTDRAHVFRMALRPREPGLHLAHEQKLFPVALRRGVLCVVASPDGRRGSLRVHDDVIIYSSILDVGQHVVHELSQARMAWLHVVRGEITLDGLVLAAGDGVGVAAELAVSFTARDETEILLVDLEGPPPTPAAPATVP